MQLLHKHNIHESSMCGEITAYLTYHCLLDEKPTALLGGKGEFPCEKAGKFKLNENGNDCFSLLFFI